MVHEVDQILTDCDDFGVVGKPLTSASQRHQNHQNPLSFDPFHDPFLISSQSQILKVFCSPQVFDRARRDRGSDDDDRAQDPGHGVPDGRAHCAADLRQLADGYAGQDLRAHPGGGQENRTVIIW